jgi:hypothetical protein
VEGQDRVNSAMHSKAVIKRGWTWYGRQTLSELSDAIGGRNRVSLKIHLEAEIE